MGVSLPVSTIWNGILRELHAIILGKTVSLRIGRVANINFIYIYIYICFPFMYIPQPMGAPTNISRNKKSNAWVSQQKKLAQEIRASWIRSSSLTFGQIPPPPRSSDLLLCMEVILPRSFRKSKGKEARLADVAAAQVPEKSCSGTTLNWNTEVVFHLRKTPVSVFKQPTLLEKYTLHIVMAGRT